MIATLHLFPVLDQKLITLLRSLHPEDWNLPTLAKRWTVKDIAAHLLDGNLRTLSLARDGQTLQPDQSIHSYQDLVGYLNRLNAEWVAASKRLSPGVLIDLLEHTGRQYNDYLNTLDLNAEAIFSVAWAGEERSLNWFHIAREYTEKWHHQQQIREAVGQPNGIMEPELYRPFIETFLQGLPHTFRNTPAETGKTIRITISPDSWLLRRDTEKWVIAPDQEQCLPEASINIPPDTAWKVFTKGMSVEEAEVGCTLTGRADLARTVLKLVAVMA